MVRGAELIATVALALCSIVVTALLIHREFFTPRPSPSPSLTAEQPDWRSYATAGHAMGPSDASATIVEFADFQCPYCKQFAIDVDSLRRAGARIRVVFRHFPLRTHRFALPAVRASECADRENKFERMHDELYRFPDSLGVVSWWWFARRAGVRDSLRFASCLNSQERLAALERDTLAARRLGIRGTPLLLIGSLRVNGLPSFDSLNTYLQREDAKGSATDK